MFKGDSADKCAGKFPLVLMGGRANGQACTDGERGPPTARAEILVSKLLNRFTLIEQFEYVCYPKLCLDCVQSQSEAS